jgi:hypothetical protein
MDISALVHRHVEAVVILACRIRHIYLLCFAFMTFLFPRQISAMDDSDKEMQLINDDDSLDSQLKQAGCPCDESLYVHLSRDSNEKPLAKRLKLWRFRKELLRKTLVATQLSATQLSLSAAPGETAATSLPVIKQETERKTKFE